MGLAGQIISFLGPHLVHGPYVVNAGFYINIFLHVFMTCWWSCIEAKRQSEMEMKYLLEEENVPCLPDIPSKKVKILRPKHRFFQKIWERRIRLVRKIRYEV